MRSPRCYRALAPLMVAALWTGGLTSLPTISTRAAEEQEPVILQPLDLGLQEQAGVSLLFLDVEVLDREGRPVRGLTQDDFEIFLDGKGWPLVAVDDFCACNQEAAGLATEETGQRFSQVDRSMNADAVVAADPGTDESASEAPAAPGQRRFALLIDFSQLKASGRGRAEEHVRRWLTTAMQPGDLALLAGHSTSAGLKVLTPFTRDRDILLQGVAAAFAAREFVDPFPELLPVRQDICRMCVLDCERAQMALCERGCCFGYAREESIQGSRSLDALDLLLTTLEGIPGPKDLILFNQSGTLFPARRYPFLDGPARFEVGDHQDQVKRVAASATAARTAVHVANLPEQGNLATAASEEARDLGTRLADYTGGTTNRAMADLDGLLATAGRRCCLYRLSLSGPEAPPNRAMRVRVLARGRRLPVDFRVQFYAPEQRWFRRALAALAIPDAHGDPPFTLAMSPVALREDGWVIQLQAAFSLSQLELVPTVSQRVGRWRVGALLDMEDGHRTWEMLSMARATLDGLGETRLEAVHERQIGDLEPGTYRLRLFVEDAQRSRFSAAEATLELPAAARPHADRPWLHGPRVSRRSDRRLSLGLPFTRTEPAIPTPVGPPSVGPIPVPNPVVEAGTLLEFTSLLCPGPHEPNDLQITAVVLREGTPIARLPQPDLRPGGACVGFTDQVETQALPPGRYEYQLIIIPAVAGEPLTATAPFAVTSLLETAALAPGTSTYRVMALAGDETPLHADVEFTPQPPMGRVDGSKSASVRPDMSTQKP